MQQFIIAVLFSHIIGLCTLLDGMNFIDISQLNVYQH